MAGTDIGTCTAESLGSAEFKKDHGVRYAYVAGSMYRGIASRELVVRMGGAGLLGFFGAGGCRLEEIEEAIRHVQQQLAGGQPYGFNLIADHHRPARELEVAGLYLRGGVKQIEASAFMQITPALAWYRVSGLRVDADGAVACAHRVMAKVSRPEVAEAFMQPAPAALLAALVKEGRVTPEQAQWAAKVPMCDDLCVEADSGGHTDRGNPTVLFPAIHVLRDRLMREQGYTKRIRVGLGGGIGTPEAAAAAFVMGADFVLTGSINQCTVEAGISEAVKDMLQEMNVQDTAYAPAGDMFEMGAKVQVLRKGVLFPARANKLHAVYTQHAAWSEVPEATRRQIEDKYFGRSFEAVWQETKSYFTAQRASEEIAKAEQNEKHRMALVFRWYFGHSFRLAREGDRQKQVDFQIHTGPALGAFNQWVAGTELASWRNRRVDGVAEKLMRETAALLNERYARMFASGSLNAAR